MGVKFFISPLGARSLSTTSQLQAQGKSFLPAESSEVTIMYWGKYPRPPLLLLLCAKIFYFPWATYYVMVNRTVQFTNSICKMFSLFFQTFSSDKEQEEFGSAWCEKHCPGWRRSNTFSDIRHYVRKLEPCGIMQFALYWHICSVQTQWSDKDLKALSSSSQLCRPDAPWFGQSCPSVSRFRVILWLKICWLG